MKKLGFGLLLASLALTGCGNEDNNTTVFTGTQANVLNQPGSPTTIPQQSALVRVFTGTGATAAALETNIVASFRTAAGATVANGNSVGANTDPTTRREINWDGVPGGVTANAGNSGNTFPADFFQATSSRGVILSTPGTSLRVADDDFDFVFPTVYGGLFNAFSTQGGNLKTFSPLGSNITDVTFAVPGSGSPGTAASTRSFGVVFSDVDLAGVTNIQLFDSNGSSLGRYDAPALNGGFSFVGVVFDNDQRIRRVRITTGNAPLANGTNEVGGVDLVIMDDFIYSNPL